MFRPLAIATALIAAAAPSSTTSAQSLVNGGSINASLIVAGQTNTHTFFANGGEGFQIQVVDLMNGALDPNVRVFDPTGSLVAGRAAALTARVAGVAPRTGTYTVEVNDGNSGMTQTGPYRVYFTRAPGANQGGTLPNGGVVSGTIDTGDLDSFSFSIQAGQDYQLRFVDSGFTSLDPRITVYDPMGSVVASDIAAAVAAVRASAPFSGTYTVVIGDGNSDPSATGAYDLYFAQMPGANSGGSLTSGGSVTDSTVIGEIDSYTFSVSAGDYFQLRLADLSSTSYDPTLWLYDPRGCFVVSSVSSLVARLDRVAVFSGTYTVLVGDGNSDPSATGNYRLNYQRVPGAVSSGSLALGSSVSGRIDIGDLDSYTFDVQAGENFVLHASDTNFTSLDPLLFVFDPLGRLIGTPISTSVTQFAAQATMSGTYRVVVADGNSTPSAVGDYELYYERFPGATGKPLFPGNVATGALTPGQLETFSFDLEVGQSFVIHAVDTGATSLDPRLRLYGPRGDLVTSAVATQVTGISGTVDRAGTYTLLLTDGNNTPSATGAYEVHLVTAPDANEHGYLVDNVVFDETIDPGDLDTYTFRANAGEVAQVSMTDVANTALDPFIVVFDPFGRRLASSLSSTVAQLTQPITRSGTYTVLARDGNNSRLGTGPYQIQVTGSGSFGNSGCSNEGPPRLTGRPALSTGFAIQVPPSSRNCGGPSFIALGTCLSNRIGLSAPFTCGPCGFDTTQSSCQASVR